MVLSWIQHSPSDNIVQFILWIDNAHTVWKNLKNRFSQGDIFKVSDLHDHFLHLHQGSLDVSTSFTKLTSLWEKIDSLRPIHDCICAIPCTCGSATDLRKYKNEDRVLKFLRGLNEPFSNVRSQIILLDPLPSLDKTFSMILGQECRTAISTPSDNPSMAITGQPTNNGVAHSSSSFHGCGCFKTGRGSSQRICTHCGRNNHTADTYFMNHGYPPGYNYKSSKATINNAIAASTPIDTPNASSEASHKLSRYHLGSIQSNHPTYPTCVLCFPNHI